MKVELSKPTIAECEAALPGFRKIWEKIKKRTESSQRAPKRLILQDEPEKLWAIYDSDCLYRFGLNLETMELSGGTYVSSGEDAINSGGKENAVSPPRNMATVDCVINDYHRSFKMIVTVSEGMMPKQITTSSVVKKAV